MKKLIGCLSAVAAVGLFTGCVGPMGPVGAVGAAVYTDVSGPLMATSNSGASKMGQAEATGIICFATGDASIKAAMDAGGITKIQHVDYHTTSILGVYAKTIVTVYGE
jgi:TRL-like protein family